MNESRNKYLLKNTAIFTIGNIGTKLISFFLVPLYTYVLNTEEYGTVDLIFTLCTLFAPFIMLSIGEAVKRFCLDRDAQYNKILSIALVCLAFGVVIAAPIVLVVNNFYLHYEKVYLIYIYLVLLAGTEVMMAYLRGREKLISYTAINISSSLLIALLNMLFLLVFDLGTLGYFYAYILSYLFQFLCAFIVSNAYKIRSYFCFDKKLFRTMLRFSVALMPNSILWWIINSSDRIMISSMIGVFANGLYAVSYKIPSILSTISSVFNQAWQYSAIKENDSNDKDEYVNSMFSGIFQLNCLAAIGIITVLKPLFSIYVSPDYYSAWEYSSVLIIGYVFLAMATFVGTSYYVEKNMVGNLISAAVGAVLNIILNFTLINYIGSMGAAISTCFSYIAIFAYRLIDTRKYQKYRVFTPTNIILTILMITAVAGLYIDHIGIYVTILSCVIAVIVNIKLIRNMLLSVLSIIKKKK